LKTDNNEYLYKIGRSKQKGLNRMKDYPNTYELVFMRKCIDCIQVERDLINLFLKKYKREFKNEYFVGNENDMINDINNTINLELAAYNLTNTFSNSGSAVVDTLVVPAEEKELIIICSKINETGKKEYFITNEVGDFLHNISNVNHMEWILNNDYYDIDMFPGNIEIKENVVYDVNDKNFIDTIDCYTNFLGNVTNVSEINHSKQDEYLNWMQESKILYLFEADARVDNLEEKYLTCADKLYLFCCDCEFVPVGTMKSIDHLHFELACCLYPPKLKYQLFHLPDCGQSASNYYSEQSNNNIDSCF
jgi:hypothetical protein